jgi:hypothetical protein
MVDLAILCNSGLTTLFSMRFPKVLTAKNTFILTFQPLQYIVILFYQETKYYVPARSCEKIVVRLKIASKKHCVLVFFDCFLNMPVLEFVVLFCGWSDYTQPFFSFYAQSCG